MDGYALIAGAAAELELIGEARAGHPAEAAVRPGTAIAISTGAAVPEGATAVVPVERTEAAGAAVRVPDTEPDANIRRAGEDIAAGETVLRAGDRLEPAAVGVAASVGRATLSCALRPRVALLVDHYAEDWDTLWWVRADGAGRVLDTDDPEAVRAAELLAARYERFALRGAVLAVEVDNWSGWSAM